MVCLSDILTCHFYTGISLLQSCELDYFLLFSSLLCQVFVAGNNHYIVERPSVKNFYKTDGEHNIFV